MDRDTLMAEIGRQAELDSCSSIIGRMIDKLFKNSNIDWYTKEFSKDKEMKK